MAKQTYAEATDREERTAALLRQLEAGVQAIQTGADFQRYLRVAARFHSYSLNNVLFICTIIVCQDLINTSLH